MSAESTERSRPSQLVAGIRTLRPKQWVKNLFVIAPLVFSKHLFDPSFALRAFGALCAFCAVSGAVYAFNDLRDAPLDRNHPEKRHRPIASGALSRWAAIQLAVALSVAGLAGSAALSGVFAAVVAGYMANNVAYTLVLKRIAFVDVLSIAGGFLLRVTGGAFAIEVELSPWLITCTALLAALLGFGKRAHELAQSRRTGRQVQDTRPSLRGYRLPVLKWLLLCLAAATITAYALYTVDARTVGFFATERLVWTAPFCALGIARFAHLALWRGGDESPTDAILRDRVFLGIMAAWAGAVLTIIYGPA